MKDSSRRSLAGLTDRLRTGLVLAALMVSGCGEKTEENVPDVLIGPVPEAQQRPGSPAAGFDVVVAGDYMSCGMPYSAWKRVSNTTDPLPELPGREGKNTGIPYWLTVHEDSQGVEIVSNNCLLCHGARFNGELVIGLGNEWLDFTGDPRELVSAIGSYVYDKKETVAWRKWGQRVSAIAPYMITDTLGVNPAPNITLALIAHRNPETLEWSPELLIEPPPEAPLPVSVPPWWRVAKKHALFYNGMGRGDHARFMMMKSLMCADSIQEAESVDRVFRDVRAYIESLDPPDYPFAIDEPLAEKGRVVFESHCSGCHGSYGADGNYPNLLVDLETVGTDKAYALQAYEESQQFMTWFNQSWYGDIAKARPAPGYVAPPLDGVWATAPFFHNGSVPTIEAVLDSDKRPRYWTRDPNAREFDRQALGWRYGVSSTGKDEVPTKEERKLLYDTTQFGYSNQGHTFGDALSNSQRTALLEYIKTL